jgi:hypothetical protein
MFNKAISTHGVPKRLSSDNDPLFMHHQRQANLRILDVDEIKIVPYTPLSHPCIERLIGSIRREFLDHILFSNATDLEKKLTEFQAYYNIEVIAHSAAIRQLFELEVLPNCKPY